MAFAGSMPPASIHGTWVESLEIWDVDTDTLADLSEVEEVILKLRDLRTRFDDMVLTMSDGAIEILGPGIVEWRVPTEFMGVLGAQLYEVIMLFEFPDEIVPLIVGTISIVE